MVEADSVAALSILISSLGLVAVAVMFHAYRLDKFREGIFAIREELFLYSFDEGLVDDPAYRQLRLLLNGLLRYAHKVTFTHMIVLVLTKRFLRIPILQDPSPMAAWKRAVEKLPDAQRETLNAINARSIELVVMHIISRSVLFWIFAAFIVVRRFATGQLVASTNINKAFVTSLVPVNLLEADALRTNYPINRVPEYS